MAKYIEQKKEGEYKVITSQMSPGEKVPCPDDSTEIEKLDNGSIKLIVKKGTAKKFTR